MSSASAASDRSRPAAPAPTPGQPIRAPADPRWRPPEGIPPAPPLVPIALALILGIATDRWLGIAQPGLSALLAAALTAAGLFTLEHGHRRIARLALLCALTVLGGGFHHARWNGLAPDDLARDGSTGQRPAWLRGVATSVPEFRPGEHPGDEGMTRLLLEVSSQCDGHNWQPASGCVLIQALGDRSDVAMGHPMEAAGVLEPIAGPRNPGEVDLRARWQAEGVRLKLHVDVPEALRPDPTGAIWPGTALLGRLRTASYARLVSGLRPDVAPLAAALLLGRYDAVDQATFADFSRTGTTHLLAISGLHMQALATVLGGVLLVLGLGRKRTAAAVIAATVAYTILVGARPSVVRSAAMTVMVAVSVLGDLRVQPANLFALAALVTVALNPAYLFDPGCQLTFLAVGALFWAVPPVAARLRLPGGGHPEPEPATPKQWLDRLERRLAPWHRRWLSRVMRGLLLAFVASLVVWVVTLPIIVHAFHMIPLSGCLLNVPLVALSTPTLASVAMLIPAGSLGGPVKDLARWLCESLLAPQRQAVAWGAGLPAGFFFCAGPPAWQLVVFYTALGATLAFSRHARTWKRVGSATLLIGSALLMIGSVVRPWAPATLEAEVLAVDHGLAVLVQAPSGQTLLYDCGKMRDPHVGARVIAPALWERGVRSIDTLVLSHADADHYGGLPELVDRLSIGEVRVPPGFDGPANPGAAELVALCRARGVPVRELVQGETIDLGANVACEALHPPSDYPTHRPDNEHSLVLAVTSVGRSLLLAGDLEGEALTRLLAGSPVRCEALLAPHHGSRAANPPTLYAWSDPRLVLLSQRPPSSAPAGLPAWFTSDGRTALTTWEHGALRVQWTDRGLTAQGYLDTGR